MGLLQVFSECICWSGHAVISLEQYGLLLIVSMYLIWCVLKGRGS